MVHARVRLGYGHRDVEGSRGMGVWRAWGGTGTGRAQRGMRTWRAQRGHGDVVGSSGHPQPRSLLQHEVSVLVLTCLPTPQSLAGLALQGRHPGVCLGRAGRPAAPLLILQPARHPSPHQAPLCRLEALPNHHHAEGKLPGTTSCPTPSPILQGHPTLCPPTCWLCGLRRAPQPLWAWLPQKPSRKRQSCG